MTDGQDRTIAEITQEARARCLRMGAGAVEAVESLCAELEKRRAQRWGDGHAALSGA